MSALHAKSNIMDNARQDPAGGEVRAEAVNAPTETRDDATPGNLTTIVRLQSQELERLAHDNQRLMDRLETLLDIQEREQVLRQQLQNQVDRLSERLALPAPGLDAAAVRREARESIGEELKPLLLAMVDLLERNVRRRPPVNGHLAAPDEPCTPEAAAHAPSPPATPAAQTFGSLPKILTEPLEALTANASEAHEGAADTSRQASAAEPRGRGASGPRRWLGRRGGRRELPEAFAWTMLFT